jgi:nucleoside-diphosphate-sugar epimerase
MERILITGATGYVGRALVNQLQRRYKLCAIVRHSSVLTALPHHKNLQIGEYDGSYSSLATIVQAFQPDAVIHLASVSCYDYTPTDLDNMIKANLQFGMHLLEAMNQAKCYRLINTGSYWQHYNTQDYSPVCLYAATKQAFEAIIDYYVDALNFQVITLKLYDVYGPGDTRKKIFPLLKKAVESRESIDLSEGEQQIDFVYIDDVVNAFLTSYHLLNENPLPQHHKYSAYSGNTVSLKSAVKLFIRFLGKEIPVNWGKRPYRDREVMQPTYGNRLPGWTTKIDVETGIHLLVEHYKQTLAVVS